MDVTVASGCNTMKDYNMWVMNSVPTLVNNAYWCGVVAVSIVAVKLSNGLGHQFANIVATMPRTSPSGFAKTVSRPT